MSEYRSYYASAGKSTPRRSAKVDGVGQERWGLLGEAADRSPIWLNKSLRQRRMVELKWLEQGKSLEMHTVNCDDEDCKEGRWTVRANPQSVVDNKRTATLVVYNEANRPVMRFEKISDDGSMIARTYDPILEADMSDADGLSDMPEHIERSPVARWIRVNVNDYAAASSQEAQKLFGEIEKEKQARIAQAQAAERAAEQARREAEEQAALVAAQEEEEERNRPASPNLAQVFASTFANEMAKNGAQQRAAVPAPAYQAASRPQRIASVAPPVQQPVRQAQPVEVAVSSSYTSHASPVISVSSETPASKLKATPEAIMVCTKPTGPHGNFKCASPLNTQTGYLGDRTGYRTPEEFVSGNEACPNARRLESSTHLVWGCGFGATGNYGYMDRSAGIDVRGRNTYYCSEKQTGCRRTSL